MVWFTNDSQCEIQRVTTRIHPAANGFMSALFALFRSGHLLARWLLLPILVATGLLGATSALATDALRVGFYDLRPLVFRDAAGKPQGLFVDVLSHIGQQENWALKFVHGTWTENLARLDSGEIDLLVSVSFSQERAKTMDFSRDAIATDWGLLYKRADSSWSSIADLSGARVSVLRGGIYTNHFMRLAKQFDIKMQFVERESYADVIADVEAGRSAAGIGSNIVGMGLEDRAKVVRSGIVFSPIQVMFATKKGAHPEIIARINHHVEKLKGDPGSVYFQYLARWIDARPAAAMPTWVVYVGGATFGAAILLALFVLVLKRQVRRKTAALRESEQNLAITLHSMGDAVIATDAVGLITRMNPTAERLTGWSLADAAGRPLDEVFRIIGDQTRQPLVNPVQRVMAHGEVVGLENHTTLLARDGQECQIADSAAPIRDASGQIVGVVLVFSDVSEKYRVEKTLAKTTSLLAHTAELAKVGSWELDLETMKMAFSREALLINEVDPQVEITLTQAFDMIHPDDRAAHQVAVEASIHTGAPWDRELRITTAKGRPIWIRSQCLVEMKQGKAVKLGGYFQDITERKRSEQHEHIRNHMLALLASDASLPTILGAIVHAVEELHPTTLCSILLLNKEGKHLEKGIAPSLPDFYNAALEGIGIGLGVGSCGTAAFTGEPVFVEDIATHPYWAHYKELAARAGLGACWSQPIHSSSGQVLGTFAIYHRQAHAPDEAELALIEQSARLASIAIERKQAEQALQSSLQEKTALLLEVHHRVKNNLQVISSLLRLEAGRSEHTATKGVLKDMQARIRAMALLHETIYRKGTFAAIDLGTYVGQVASQSIKTLSTTPGAVALRLEINSVQVGLDQATPCGMLISELVSNCLKHGFPPGRTGEVCIELYPLNKPGQWRLRVSDTGIGLPEGFAARQKGSLGLQLVGDLAIQMGGVLEVGAGPQAVFTVDFKTEKPAPIAINL